MSLPDKAHLEDVPSNHRIPAASEAQLGVSNTHEILLTLRVFLLEKPSIYGRKVWWVGHDEHSSYAKQRSKVEGHRVCQVEPPGRISEQLEWLKARRQNRQQHRSQAPALM